MAYSLNELNNRLPKLIVIMKTAKESLEIYLGGNMNTCTLTPSAIEDLMKTYAKYVLEVASESATIDRHYQHGGNILWDASVNKQSILSLKDKI